MNPASKFNGLGIVLLAGGLSQRMGRDKLTLRWPPAAVEAQIGQTRDGESASRQAIDRAARPDQPRTLLERVLNTALRLQRELGAARPTGLLLDGQSEQQNQERSTALFLACGSRTVDIPAPPGVFRCDDGPGRGPAAGLLGAAAAAPERTLLVVGADLPFVTVDLLRRIVDLGRSGFDLVVPELGNRLHPVSALYSPRALAALAVRVERGDYDLFGLVGSAEELGLQALRASSTDLGRSVAVLERELFNCNTPEQWRRAQQMAALTLKKDSDG